MQDIVILDTTKNECSVHAGKIEEDTNNQSIIASEKDEGI